MEYLSLFLIINHKALSYTVWLTSFNFSLLLLRQQCGSLTEKKNRLRWKLSEFRAGKKKATLQLRRDKSFIRVKSSMSTVDVTMNSGKTKGHKGTVLALVHLAILFQYMHEFVSEVTTSFQLGIMCDLWHNGRHALAKYTRLAKYLEFCGGL